MKKSMPSENNIFYSKLFLVITISSFHECNWDIFIYEFQFNEFKSKLYMILRNSLVFYDNDFYFWMNEILDKFFLGVNFLLLSNIFLNKDNI